MEAFSCGEGEGGGGGREEKREEGREEWKEGGREGGREEWKEGGREGGREGRKERGREGWREGGKGGIMRRRDRRHDRFDVNQQPSPECRPRGGNDQEFRMAPQKPNSCLIGQEATEWLTD